MDLGPQGRISETFRSGVFAVVLPFLAALFRGFVFPIGIGGIGITPGDFAALVVGGLLLFHIVRHRSVKITRQSALAIVFFSLLVLWHAFKLFESPQPIRGLTLIIQLLRNGVLLVTIVILTKPDDVPVVNRVLFVVSAIIGTLTGVFYVLATVLTPYASALFTEVHHLSRYATSGRIRAQWFVEDPNFFALLLLVGLLCGLQIRTITGRTTALKYAGIAVTGGAILLTMSRSVIGMTAILVVVMYIIRPEKDSHPIRLRRLGVLSGTGALLGGVLLVTTDTVQERLKDPLLTGRGELWQTVLATLERPVLGTGLRAAESLLGRYVHNSYLTLLYDTGFVGLGLFASFVWILSYQPFRKWVTTMPKSVVPWFAAWIAVLGFNVVFTYLYLPMSWVVPATLLAALSDSETG